MKKVHLKLSSPISSNQIFSSEGEFDFSLIDEYITSIHEAFENKKNESSSQDHDEVRGIKSQKNKIIDSRCQMLFV